MFSPTPRHHPSPPPSRPAPRGMPPSPRPGTARPTTAPPGGIRKVRPDDGGLRRHRVDERRRRVVTTTTAHPATDAVSVVFVVGPAIARPASRTGAIARRATLPPRVCSLGLSLPGRRSGTTATKTTRRPPFTPRTPDPR